MLNTTDNLLIYTDLDGSLLDHNNYTWQAARHWLKWLITVNVPVIITTSKTAAEISQIQQELGLGRYPFIAENGAHVVFPDGWEKVPLLFSIDYLTLCNTLQKLREQNHFEFTGFADINDRQLAEWTGLTPAKAQRAKQRLGSEPIRWHGDDRQLSTFRSLLNSHNLKLVKGGRFLHVLGRNVSKGSAVYYLTQYYQQRHSHPLTTLGFGDAQNDISLLCTTDYAVLIRNQQGSPPVMPGHFRGHLYRTQQEGPAGWCEGLENFLLVNAKEVRIGHE